MIESQFTQKLLKELRARLGPGAVVAKIADGYTSGIPDFFVGLNGKDSWFEVKLTTNRRIYEPLQMATLQKLRGDYIIWNPATKEGILQPATQSGAITDATRWLPFATLVDAIISEVKR